MFLLAVVIIIGIQLELNHRASLKLEKMQSRVSEMQQTLREENKGRLTNNGFK